MFGTAQPRGKPSPITSFRHFALKRCTEIEWKNTRSHVLSRFHNMHSCHEQMPEALTVSKSFIICHCLTVAWYDRRYPTLSVTCFWWGSKRSLFKHGQEMRQSHGDDRAVTYSNLLLSGTPMKHFSWSTNHPKISHKWKTIKTTKLFIFNGQQMLLSWKGLRTGFINGSLSTKCGTSAIRTLEIKNDFSQQ